MVGRPFREHRQVVEGIVYRYRAGVAWDLLEEFGPWQTVWEPHRRFSLDGAWDRQLSKFFARADAAGVIDWSVSVESAIRRAYQRGTTLPRNTRRPDELHESAARAGSSCAGPLPWRALYEGLPACDGRPAAGRAGRPGSGPRRAGDCRSYSAQPACVGWVRDEPAPARRGPGPPGALLAVDPDDCCAHAASPRSSPNRASQRAHRKRGKPASRPARSHDPDAYRAQRRSAPTRPQTEARPGHPLRQRADIYRGGAVLSAILAWLRG